MNCRLNIFILFSLSAIISSCTQDAYDKGEGKYSLMRGDFVEAQVDANKQIVSITTDDGDILPLVNPYPAKWVTKGDTIYRCMLYYNKVESEKGQYAAEVVSIGQVPCPTLKRWSEFKQEYRTDPVKFESIWLSKSRKYLNLYMQLKTGVTDDTTAVQQLAFVSDTIIINKDETRSHRIVLHHDQNKVPEYYSTKAYVSIPVSAIAADSVSIWMNTYDGPISKTLSLYK